MSLFSLAYVSTATQRMTDDDLRSILHTARAFNAARGITGMLTYFGQTFVQVLEGEREEVLELLRCIRHDPRHHSLAVTRTREIESRAFPGWSMAFVNAERFRGEAGVSPSLDPSFAAEALLAHAERADELMAVLRPALGEVRGPKAEVQDGEEADRSRPLDL
jgi:hypothetical protein